MTTTPARAASRPRTPAPPPPDGVPVRTGYARLPQLAGRAFLPVAFLARLPFSMLTIGTLLLVSSTTSSVALGGLASAATALGTALGGPTQGALADRVGQRRVLLVCVPVATVAVLALVLSASAPGATAAVLLAAAATGASAPQVGPLARVRWLRLAADEPRTVEAAMSYESTADEVSFVLGPALVGVLASAGSPQVAVLAAAGGIAVFGAAFALHPTARATAPHGTGPHGTTAGAADAGGTAALMRREAVVLVGMLAMGLLFGGTQAALTALTRDAGVPGSAGLVYAVMGVGSAITALSVVALPRRWGLRSRWITFAAGLLVGTAGLVLAAAGGSLTAVVVAVAATGLFVGPVMVTVFTVAGERAPAGRTASAMTLVASANVVGVAIGASGGGALADTVSTTSAFALPVVAAVLLVVTGVSLTSRPQGERRTGDDERERVV
ncbi:MFS transporter [Cellulosimicrobium funkei]|uniref:MFS transporter n=1 Tax=Cellulosimicrobium funkei TaxID=264251 RepID=A0A4Y8QYC2_9MICO|nr:MFS transporter [Cellulosimicrobium funkei]TFF03716.1 MFS transporter [Cellulosimicrobium funkei]TGA67372.1 MFS transporter [Cellulosimicrobium terreum]